VTTRTPDEWAKRFEEKFDELQLESWKDIKCKLDSMLVTNNLLSSENTKLLCNQLADVEHNERINIILQYWGKPFKDKAMPLLLQLKCLEEN
tara:strand:+ start:3229 stop:3504 length:276 start_codon:yes stop_codon:yes gene_type:complete